MPLRMGFHHGPGKGGGGGVACATGPIPDNLYGWLAAVQTSAFSVNTATVSFSTSVSKLRENQFMFVMCSLCEVDASTVSLYIWDEEFAGKRLVLVRIYTESKMSCYF